MLRFVGFIRLYLNGVVRRLSDLILAPYNSEFQASLSGIGWWVIWVSGRRKIDNIQDQSATKTQVVHQRWTGTGDWVEMVCEAKLNNKGLRTVVKID